MKGLCFALISLFSFSAYADCNLLSNLQESGFENLYITRDSKMGLLVHYENRKFRFEGDALFEVLKIINAQECEFHKVQLVIYNKGIPITEFHSSKPQIQRLFEKSISIQRFLSDSKFQFSNPKKARFKGIQSSLLRSDIAVGARTDYLLGNFDNPIRWTPSILPSFQTTLSKGVLLNATYGIVLYDDLYFWEKSRWRYAFASYNEHLPGNIFTRISAGFFEQTQFGVEGHFSKFFHQDKFRLDINLSLTENRFLQTPPGREAIDKNHFSYGVKATYRYTPWTTDLSIHYGRYIFDDTGYTLLMQRQFNEVYIGFFMREVDRKIVGSFGNLYDKNYGFQLTVPIGTKKHMKTRSLRLRTEEQFSLDYNYTGGVDIGRRIHVPGSIINELEEYYPSTLRKALETIFSQRSNFL